MTNMNVVVLCGVLSADPEHRTFASGSSLLRLLVTVRNDSPKRVDVIPVTLWDPPSDLLDLVDGRGQRVWVAGTIQRRFWAGRDGRRSSVDVVARAVQFPAAGEFQAADEEATAEH